MTPIEQAYREYEASKRGDSPVGIWIKPDDWREMGDYLIPDHERQECCSGIGNLKQHVKTAKHIAHVFGLDPEAFTRYVNVRRQNETRRKRRQHA